MSGSYFFGNRLESMEFKMFNKTNLYFVRVVLNVFLFAYTIVAPHSSHGGDVFDFTLGAMFCVVGSANLL